MIQTAGFQPSCECFGYFVDQSYENDPDRTWRKFVASAPVPASVPCVVLDPFSGSATTGKVCAKLGRRYIGVDLAAEYLGAVTDARMGDGVQMELVG